MKKNIFILIIFGIVLLLPQKSVAQSPTVTPKPTTSDEKLTDQISELKDRIASRVAELKLVEKRGIIGTVTDVSNTQITLTDMHDGIRFIDVDELTKFASPSAKSFGISDIEKGKTLGVLGNYNKQSRRLLGRFVSVVNLDTKISGAIKEIDSVNFTLTVVTDDNKTHVIDNETTTKIQMYSKSTGLVRGGFSRLEPNKRVLVAVYTNPKTGKLSASRILQLTDIPLDPKNPLKQNSLQQSPPATSSGTTR